MPATIIKGDKILARRFQALLREASGGVLTASAVAGASVIRDEAERLAPKRTGKGAASIKFEIRMISRNRASVDIGYDKRAWYMRFQELGTKFHSAQPHLRPAMDGKKDEGVRAVGRVLALGVEAARQA